MFDTPDLTTQRRFDHREVDHTTFIEELCSRAPLEHGPDNCEALPLVNESEEHWAATPAPARSTRASVV